MTTPSLREVALKSVRFKLNSPWKDNLAVPPWLFTLESFRGDVESRIGHDFAVTGTLQSELWRETMWVAVNDVFYSWETNPTNETVRLHLIQDEFEFIPVSNPEKIWVRLNTPWLKDKSLPPWRILTFFPDGSVKKEEPARSFVLRGYAYSAFKDFGGKIGPKMHVACRGEIIWDASGNAFIAATRPDLHPTS